MACNCAGVSMCPRSPRWQANVLALDHKHQVVAAPRAVDIVVLGLDARHGEPARLVRAGRIEQDVVPPSSISKCAWSPCLWGL